jgi:hypothetical protein
MNAEKNDVNISKLFSYGDKFDITDRNGKKVLTVYIRLVGDADLNRARVYAIRRSAEMRERLRSNDSDESLAFIPPFEAVEKTSLIETCLAILITTFTRDALRSDDLPQVPHEPSSSADLEVQEQYQKAVDEYPQKRTEAINKYITKRSSVERKRLEKLELSEIYDYYKRLVVADLCEQEMLNKFREMCVFYGTFLDENYTIRAFPTFEQFENLPIEIKTQFISNYSQLDIGSEDLKK